MSPTAIILSTTAVTLIGAYTYATYLRRSLQIQIRHQSIDAAGRRAASNQGELESLPGDLLDYPQNFRIVHDRDERRLSKISAIDRQDAGELFTKLVRRNMAAFSNLPQSWMMSMMAKTPEQRESFKKSHLLGIDYREGDLFCGFYRVIKRGPLKVEIDMEPPPRVGSMSGRLVFSLHRTMDGAFLRTETLQWVAKDAETTLPLEKPPIRFMHEIASAWLLVSGAEYLESLT